MNEEIKRILNTLKENYDDIGLSYYPCDLFNRDDPKILYDYIIELHNKIGKVIELNNQIIKDIKSFYRPTSDTIYSGDCLMDIAGQNLKILKGSDVDE